MDTLFKAANYEDKATDKEAALVNSLNDDTALTRFEFVEICVRVADAKFIKSAQSETLADAIEALFERFIVPNVAPEALVDANEFREKRLYTEEVEDAARQGQGGGEKVHPGRYANPRQGQDVARAGESVQGVHHAHRRADDDNAKHMTMEQWIEMLTTPISSWTTGTRLTMREARLAFVHSRCASARVRRRGSSSRSIHRLARGSRARRGVLPASPLDELR